MLISHESPLALLEKSRTYNDYSYALVHLFEKYPHYYEFFVEEKRIGRKVLLDNSMFELRKAFDADKFAQWIVDLRPDEYIVPDVFSDSKATIASFESWKETYGNIPGNAIGVIQGTTYQEIINCYRYMTENADKIAFSFECPYFYARGYLPGPTSTKWQLLSMGRVSLIQDLINDGIWNDSIPHHLLGCATPQEFMMYTPKQRLSIESIDTSNPVVAGMHGVRYTMGGLEDKITAKLADMLETPVSDKNWEDIRYNLTMFRKINHLEGKLTCQE